MLYSSIIFGSKMRKVVFWALLVCHLTVTTSVADSNGLNLPWVSDLEEAFYLAKKDKKLVIADLYTDWCTWCKVMDDQTYADPSIVKDLGPRYVWLRLNTETEEDGITLQRRFRIHGYPTTVIIEPEEGLYEKTQGFLSPEKFRQMVTHYSQTLGKVIDLRNQVRNYPEQIELKLELANEYFKRESYQRAEGVYRGLIKQDSSEKGTEQYFYWLALSLANQEKEAQALKYLNYMRDRFPNSEFTANGMGLEGEIHMHLGERTRAAKVWGEYLKRFPEHQMADSIRRRLKEMELE